jgi:uncharacterized protein YehS (DUF1456 family)
MWDIDQRTEPRASARGRLFEQRHGFALLSNNILDRCPNGIFYPQVARAAMLRPAAEIAKRRGVNLVCRSLRVTYT